MAKQCRNKPRGTPMSHTLVAMVSIYKSSQWLKDRINNLMQTNIYKRGELLIFLANASSPDPHDSIICSHYAGQPNIRYEVIPFCSVYQTWNYCVSKTNTTYISNSNSDDLNSPDCYDILIDACKSGAVVAHSDWYTIGSNIKNWGQISGTASNANAYSPETGQLSCGHAPLWKRELHDRIGYFRSDMRALGDAEFFMRAWVNNIRNFTFVNMPLIAYRWRDEPGNRNLWWTIQNDHGDIMEREWSIVHRKDPAYVNYSSP